MSRQYRGKWVSKNESEEAGTAMLDVIEVVNNEVKAVGRNLSLTELLANYIPIEESGIRIVDPFAVADMSSVADEIDTSILAEHIEEKSEVFVYEPASNKQLLDAAKQLNRQTPITDVLYQGQADEKQSLSEEEKRLQTILDMIVIAEEKAAENVTVTIPLTVDLSFNVKSFIEAGKLLSLNPEEVIEALSVHINNKLSNKYIVERLGLVFADENFKQVVHPQITDETSNKATVSDVSCHHVID